MKFKLNQANYTFDLSIHICWNCCLTTMFFPVMDPILLCSSLISNSAHFTYHLSFTHLNTTDFLVRLMENQGSVRMDQDQENQDPPKQRAGVIDSSDERSWRTDWSTDIYIYKGRVLVTMYVTSSLLNWSTDRKTDYTIGFLMVQGWFLS